MLHVLPLAADADVIARATCLPIPCFLRSQTRLYLVIESMFKSMFPHRSLIRPALAGSPIFRMEFKAQVHSKNNLLSIEPEKSDKPIKKKFEQNRMTNKKVMNF